MRRRPKCVQLVPNCDSSVLISAGEARSSREPPTSNPPSHGVSPPASRPHAAENWNRQRLDLAAPLSRIELPRHRGQQCRRLHAMLEKRLDLFDDFLARLKNGREELHSEVQLRR